MHALSGIRTRDAVYEAEALDRGTSPDQLLLFYLLYNTILIAIFLLTVSYLIFHILDNLAYCLH
jgi:hypothetical protein